MKRLIVVAALVAGVAAGTSWAETPPSTPPSGGPKGPRIEFKEDRFDAGKVKQGDAAVHVFEFRNAGDEVLEIQKVTTS